MTLLFPTLLLAVEPDLSSPKSAATSLYHAIEAGDAAGVRAALYAPDEAQADYAAAMAHFIIAGKRIDDAMNQQFGAAAAAPGGIAGGTLDPADLDRLNGATVESIGDTARLTVAGQPRPMSFRRTDGKWRLVLTDLSASAPAEIAKRSRLVHLLADAMASSADEIAAGKFKTADAANAAIQQRLTGVMLTFHRPATTRASTSPSSAAATTQAKQR